MDAIDAEQLYESGRFDEALAAWQAVVSREPASRRARARVAACLLGLERHVAAADLLEALVAEAPDQPGLHYRLAVARAAMDQTEAALQALDAAAGAGLRLAAGIDAEPAFSRLRGGASFPAVRERIAANDHPTAADERFRSFDFWVGSWEARTADGVLQGHNRIEIVLGGAAILERWTGASGYRGLSLNRYDRHAGTWRQTWVDDQGDIVEFHDGRVADGHLVFSAEDADGGRRRLTFEDRGPDAFGQLSERSDDGGTTWIAEYDFRYSRLTQPAASAT